MYFCNYLKYTEHSKERERSLVLCIWHEGCPNAHFQLFIEEECDPVNCLQKMGESVSETGSQMTHSAYFKPRNLSSLVTFLSCFPLKQHDQITLEKYC